ncbi:MAG: BON domain-containing protein [Polyangiaceae bacterium]
MNERDRNDSSQTPMDQGGSEADRKITQQIRQALMGEANLSFTAKNVKIITNQGKVTLRGPVNTERERSVVLNAAKRVAGVVNVDDQLEVK